MFQQWFSYSAIGAKVTRLTRPLDRSVDPSHLPDEILRPVFALYAEGCLDPRDSEVLAQVCIQWRRVALNQSALWRHIDLLWSEGRFEAWIRRSGSQPLILECIFNTDVWLDAISQNPFHRFERLALRRLDAVARAQSFRVQVLDSCPLIHSEADEVVSWLLAHASSVISLNVALADEDCYTRGLTINVSNLPLSIRSLRLNNVTLISPKFPDLTALELTSVSFDYENWIAMIQSFKSLEYLKIRRAGYSGLQELPKYRSQHPVVLPSLKTLHLLDASWMVIQIFGVHCHMPVLNHLEISERHNKFAQFDIRMISCLNVVESLKCDLDAKRRPAFFTALSHYHRLQDLELCWPYSDMRSELTRYVAGRNDWTKSPVAARKALRTLRIKGCSKEDADWLRARVHHVECLGD